MAIAATVGEWWMPTAETTKQKSTHAKPITKPMQTTPWLLTYEMSNPHPFFQRQAQKPKRTKTSCDNVWNVWFVMDGWCWTFSKSFSVKTNKFLIKNAICQMSYIKATMPKCPSETSPQVDKHNLKTAFMHLYVVYLLILWTCLAWAKHEKMYSQIGQMSWTLPCGHWNQVTGSSLWDAVAEQDSHTAMLEDLHRCGINAQWQKCINMVMPNEVCPLSCWFCWLLCLSLSRRLLNIIRHVLLHQIVQKCVTWIELNDIWEVLNGE